MAAALASAMGFGLGDSSLVRNDHLMVPSAFPLTRPDDPCISTTLPGAGPTDDLAFADQWDALLNDPIALDNIGLLAATTTIDNNNIHTNNNNDPTLCSPYIPTPSHQPPCLNINAASSTTSPAYPAFSTDQFAFESINHAIEPTTSTNQPFYFPTTSQPTTSSLNTGHPGLLPLDIDTSMHAYGDISTFPPAPPPSITSPFDTISNPFSPHPSTPGTSAFPTFFPHNQSPLVDLNALHHQQQTHLNQHHQQNHQQRRSFGWHLNQLPLADSHYNVGDRRHSLVASSSAHSPATGFHFAPYLINHHHESPGVHSPTSSYHSTRPHTHSNLNPNACANSNYNPPVFSPALSGHNDQNPFDLGQVPLPRTAQSPGFFPPAASYLSAQPFQATSDHSASFPEADHRAERPLIDELDKPVPLPRRQNKYKKRALPRPDSPHSNTDPLLLIGKETKGAKDPLDSLNSVSEDPAETDAVSATAAVKGGSVEREPSPLVEHKPRPIQELLQNWDRSPSPPPLLTGPPYRVRTESPESLKRLEVRRGKIIVRGGSLIGLGLGFSPKEEGVEELTGCLCDPLGLSKQDCWRKGSSSGGSRTRNPSGEGLEASDDEMNPISGVVAGVKRKSDDGNKGKSKDLQPIRPGINTMLGKSILELPPGQAPAQQVVHAPKRKKPRIALSCAQCTKRKQKCNRQIPCQHCTSRRIPEQCVPYIPGQPLPESTKAPSASRSGRKPKKSTEVKTEEAMTPDAGSSTGPGTHAMSVSNEASSPATSTSEGDDQRRRSSVHIPTLTPGSSYLSPFAEQASAHDVFSPPRGSVAPSPFSVASILAHDEPHRGASMNGMIHAQDLIRPIAPAVEPPNFTRQSSSGPSIGHRSSSRDGRHAFDQMSRSASAGETAVDAAKWFATHGTVPGVETLRGDAKIELNLDDCGQPSENLAQLIRDCGVSPRKISELVNELPSYTLASQLVDWFFSHINYVRYPIHEAGFRAAFEDMYRKKGGNGPEPHNVRSLPLIFIVLATSVRLAPSEWAGNDTQRKMTSLKMYWGSRRSILIATAIQPESLELVVTRLLSALYLVLIHDRRLTECWSQLGASLRTAQAIGLHRDGTKFGLDPVQTEYRRRVWSFLYHADRNYSLILGRPPSIIDAYCDTKEPMNLEFSKVVAGQTLIAKPFHEPTSSTFIILRKRFAKIVADITYLFNKLHEEATFEEVEALDKQLREFVDNLPPHFRYDNPDKSLDRNPEYSYIPIHRFYLATEIFFIIITLHRPWLLRKLKSSKYALSRKACFDAAKMDFRIRQVFRADYPGVQNAYVGGQYREFNAAMIAGIYAIILPRGGDAEEMRSSLRTFLEQRPLYKVEDMTSRREITIIQTLYRRACQVLDPSTVNTSDAALLLGLREGEASRTTSGNGPDAEILSDVKPVITDTTATPAVFHGHMQTFPTFMMGAVQPGQGTVRPNALSKVTATAPYQPLSHATHRHRLSTSATSAVTQQDHKSPASIGSHEDEHPQRLLNQWLSANSSLAVGNMNDTDFGMLSLPTLSQGIEHGSGRMTVETTLGPSMDPENWDGLLSPNGTTRMASSRDPIMADQAMAYQEPQRDTFHGISDRMAGCRQYVGDVGADLIPGFDVNLGDEGLNMASGFEQDDSYWNTIIDGILNQA